MSGYFGSVFCAQYFPALAAETAESDVVYFGKRAKLRAVKFRKFRHQRWSRY